MRWRCPARVLAAVVNLRTGFNLNREVGSRFLHGMDNLSRIPAVKHVADSYLQLTFCHLRKLRAFARVIDNVLFSRVSTSP